MKKQPTRKKNEAFWDLVAAGMRSNPATDACAKPRAVSARRTGHRVEFRWPATGTFITEADGHYRFGQLASDVDYQLWAEFKGHKSKTRAISSFDSKKQFNFDLKVETK